MPPKPSFRVKLLDHQQENVPAPTTSTTTSFALPGTLAEDKQKRRTNSFTIQKTRLSEWNLNTITSHSSASSGQSSRPMPYGMPTPETPLNLLNPVELETGAYRDVAGGEFWTVLDTLPPLTPPPSHKSTLLRSPFSLSPVQQKENCTLHESEAIEALLTLRSPRHNVVTRIDDCDMLIDLDIPTQSIVDLPETPLSPLFASGTLFPNFSDIIDSRDQLAALPDENSIDAEFNVPRHHKPRIAKAETILTALESLREARISVMDLIHYILTADTSDFYYHRFNFLSDDTRIHELLDIIWGDKKSKPTFESWLQDLGVQHVCKLVSKEMESAKPLLKMSLKEVTPEYVENWDINEIMDPVAAVTPTWSRILHAATEPQKKIDASNPDARNRPTTRNIISASVHYLRSLASCKVQIILGTTAWASGASHRMIDILHQSGLSLSNVSISSILDSLAEHSLGEARKVIRTRPCSVTYDNVNMSTSEFIEQTENTPNKVQSGSFPVIYELVNAKPEDMKLAPLLSRLRSSSPLEMSDLRLCKDAKKSFVLQSSLNVWEVLLKHVQEFEYLSDHPLLVHPERRTLPKGHKTKFYCLRANTIEEASIQGNILVHNDIFCDQLKLDSTDPILNMQAIPTMNDQLTNARIHGAQASRAEDVSPYEQRLVFQISFGTFHLVMNFIWGILHTHRGANSDDIGSLSHFFVVLEKTRLGGEHPDYHTLLAALTQIVEGLLLNAWRSECGFDSLKDYAKSKPSAEEILQKAHLIIKKYATPECKQEYSVNPPKEQWNNSDPGPDTLYSNTVLLVQDLLYVIELIGAISAGDFGRIEDILPDLACMFRGAGSNNYSTEILHFLFNVKEVWTPEFANIMRDNMLVNPSGLDGHAMPIDLNIEHLIGDLKALFAAKGMYANWDRLGNISACANHLQAMKKQVSRSVKASYRGSTHTAADTSSLVWCVANKARELDLQVKLINRRSDSQPTRSTVDLRQLGRDKFQSASLATFNKKLADFKVGCVGDREADDITAPNFCIGIPSDNTD